MQFGDCLCLCDPKHAGWFSVFFLIIDVWVHQPLELFVCERVFSFICVFAVLSLCVFSVRRLLLAAALSAAAPAVRSVPRGVLCVLPPMLHGHQPLGLLAKTRMKTHTHINTHTLTGSLARIQDATQLCTLMPEDVCRKRGKLGHEQAMTFSQSGQLESDNNWQRQRNTHIITLFTFTSSLPSDVQMTAAFSAATLVLFVIICELTSWTISSKNKSCVLCWARPLSKYEWEWFDRLGCVKLQMDHQLCLDGWERVGCYRIIIC